MMKSEEKSGGLQAPLRLSGTSDEEEAPHTDFNEEVEPYRSVIPVEYRNVYGIPFILMRSHYYGGMKVFLTVTSIISYFVNSYVSPTKNFFTDQIVTHTIEYVICSWVVAPFMQTHELIVTPLEADDDNSGNRRRRRRCRRCRDGKIVKKPPPDVRDPQEINTRYIPFSLYNDVFMMMNEGYMLNRDINESLDYFPCNVQLVIQSVIYRGILNFFLFLNALYQVRYVFQEDNPSYIGIILTVNSLLICTLNLQAYVWATVFCVLIFPYWIYTLLKNLLCFSEDDDRNTCSNDRNADGSRKIKKGTYVYACLLFIWKRINF